MDRAQEDIRNAEAENQPNVAVTHEELMAELVSRLTFDYVTDDDITADNLSKKTGSSSSVVSHNLLSLYNQGKLTRTKKKTRSGHLVYVYHPVDNRTNVLKE